MPDDRQPVTNRQRLLVSASVLAHAAILAFMVALLLLQVASVHTRNGNPLRRLIPIVLALQAVVQTPLALAALWVNRELAGWKRCLLVAPIPAIVGIELLYFLLASLLRTMGGDL